MDIKGSGNLMTNFDLLIDQPSNQTIDLYSADEPMPQKWSETLSKSELSLIQQEEEKDSCSLIGVNGFHLNGYASLADFLQPCQQAPSLYSSILQSEHHCQNFKNYGANHCSFLDCVSSDRLLAPDQLGKTYAC